MDYKKKKTQRRSIAQSLMSLLASYCALPWRIVAQLSLTRLIALKKFRCATIVFIFHWLFFIYSIIIIESQNGKRIYHWNYEERDDSRPPATVAIARFVFI